MLIDVDAIAVSGFLRLVICHISSSRRRLLVRALVRKLRLTSEARSVEALCSSLTSDVRLLP
jgi:hypothetical protein